MASSVTQYLERDPHSSYRQFSIKRRRIKARTLYGRYMSAEDPQTVEQIAAEYSLSIEAVKEAIAYCQSNPPEIAEDHQREETILRMVGAADPDNPRHVQPRPLSPQQWTELLRR
jgi:uncharacterized protein (DUF433 family)